MLSRKRPQAEEEDEVIEKDLMEGEVSRRIDDPIRMYLTQMGQIPLLTRKDEISLARKIEIARMAFRRKMLQCDYCARNAMDLLQQVLSTARCRSTARSRRALLRDGQERHPQADAGEPQDGRATAGHRTRRLSRRSARHGWPKSTGSRSSAPPQEPPQDCATLLEELSLRTSRIQSMKNKLHGICQKMQAARDDDRAGDATTS